LNLTYFTNMIIMDHYLVNSNDFKDTYVKSDSRTYTDWKEYMRIGFFGAIQECLIWWNLNICFLFSGYLGVTQIAT
jgi:hypothetical protein